MENLFLVLLVTFLLPIAVLSSWTSIDRAVHSYHALFLVLTTGMLGVFMARDLVMFYFFWELVLIPMFLIIGVWGGPRRVYAGIKFFLYTFIGSLFMLVAILYIGFKTGDAMAAAGVQANDRPNFLFENAIAYLQGIRCDGRIGRHSPALLARAGYQDIALDFVTVDTLRVDRGTFAGIMRAWRDGYSEVLADASGRSAAEVTADFDTIIRAIETPPYYAVWHVPVVSGRKPGHD